MAAHSVELTRLAIRVHLALHRARVTPAVRIWLDTSTDTGLQGEHEIQLELVQPWTWVGDVAVDCSARPFFYRVGISAAVGVDWSLRIHDRDTRRDLAVDGDRLALPKCWLVGTCVRQQAGTVIELSTRQPRRHPHWTCLRSV